MQPSLLLLSILPFGKRNVELCKHMTRWESHELQILRVPRTQNDPAIVRIVLQLVDHLRQLIHTLARIDRSGIDVLCAEVPLLEPVHGTLSRLISVPDLDASLGEREGRHRARYEPQQLRDDGAQEDAFRREERQDGRPSGRGEGEFERLRGDKK
jgi:hypothetical protein